MRLKLAAIVFVGSLVVCHIVVAQQAVQQKVHIQEVQSELRALGYDPGVADGAMGSKTATALRKFQSDHGLQSTGTLDQKTLDALKTASASVSGTPVHPKGDKAKSIVHKASEEDEWGRTLQSNSEAGYVNFYKEFPETRRLVVLEGTLQAVIGAEMGAGGFTNVVILQMNGASIHTMPVQEAQIWDLVLQEPVGVFNAVIRQRPSIANARIIMLKDPDKIVCVDTNGGIHEAARNGDLAKVEALVRDQADLVSRKDTFGSTPLHWTALFGHMDVAEFLLTHKADVNAKTDHLETALHFAAQNDHRDVAELLLANGADVNAMNAAGTTALQFAEQAGHKEMADLLRQHGGHE